MPLKLLVARLYDCTIHKYFNFAVCNFCVYYLRGMFAVFSITLLSTDVQQLKAFIME